ncbi:MAG TPA: SCO family protein [Candidatus Polarisedimenticolia bacterium]|nr:SCO family protein [Candidatus Polarisedimenticolia bacterium]
MKNPGDADPARPPALRGIGIDQRLGAQLDLGLTFKDEAGATVRLGDYFDARPVILTLNYYECPMLCTLELNGLVAALRTMSLEPERDFRIVTVSINPKETPELAARKKTQYVKEYGRAGAAAGWHFLTGDEDKIKALANVVGFRYSFDPESKQYAHAAGIAVATPDGRLSRYFYGIEFAPRDLRLGLVESSQGKIGTLADMLLLFCYHYDPGTGRYAAAALNMMRLAGIATVILLAFGIRRMVRRSRQAAAGKSLQEGRRAL